MFSLRATTHHSATNSNNTRYEAVGTSDGGGGGGDGLASHARGSSNTPSRFMLGIL